MTSRGNLLALSYHSTSILLIYLCFIQDHVDVCLSQPLLCSFALDYTLFRVFYPKRRLWIGFQLLDNCFLRFILTIVFCLFFVAKLWRTQDNPFRNAISNYWWTCHSLLSCRYFSKVLSLFHDTLIVSQVAYIVVFCLYNSLRALYYISYSSILVLYLYRYFVLILLFTFLLTLL